MERLFLSLHHQNLFMKKIPCVLLAILFSQALSFSQENHIQNPTLAISFLLNDFKSASAVRATSLSTAIKNRQFGKVKDMSPGLAISYIQGFSGHFDFSTTLAGSFLDYPQQNRAAFGTEYLLLEGDASVRGKLFTNKYWLTPFLQAGIGASKYKGYFGAFLPVGFGLQLNFFDEAYLLLNSQYRIPVTETANYHFYHSVGLAGNIGKRKSQ
jgi:hypothetical protein